MITICYPRGACGNHLRWLLFLDKQIHNPFTDDQSIQGKVNFILNDVYTENRTWYNWLKLESKLSADLLDQYSLIHNIEKAKFMSSQQDQITIFLTVSDPTLVINHLMNVDIINAYALYNNNDNYTFFPENLDENMKIFYVDSLYEKNLNYDLYKNIINFLGFDDNYELANQIQNRYYNIRKKSAAEFYSFFTSTQFNDLLLYLQKFSEQDD